MAKPSVGRIVHYNGAGAHQAAVVTRTFEGDFRVNLFVFWDGIGRGNEPIVERVENGLPDEPGTWHWPEREE
jgi:hypothetical protein